MIPKTYNLAPHERGTYVSALSPFAIYWYYIGGSVRTANNDQKDSVKTAKLALGHWVYLRYDDLQSS